MASHGAPDPSRARDLAEFIAALAELRLWAGGQSYRALAKRVGPLLRPPQVIAHTTISDVFQPQRRRLDVDLVTAVVRALGVEEPGVARWRQACVRVHASSKAGVPAEALRQLPADLATLTGRDVELERLVDIAAACDSGATTVVISAIDGMAGAGKTALAVHAGHLLAEKFPDGQLFVSLHAHTAGTRPRDPNEALGQLLQALGLDPRAIPPDVEERAKIFRNRLSGTRTLILLDDAASEHQVRHLLPAAPGCLVLVTSRNRLKALDDAQPLTLDVLTPADAILLLRRHAGSGRIAADDPTAARIAELCGYLPLALRITAANLTHRRAWTLDHLETRLRAGLADLAAFDDGDRRVRAAFDLSYHHLTPDQQTMFRLLGVIPGPDADVYAAAALVDADLNRSDTLLQDLTDRSLLTEYAPGRYRLHDLLREYANALAAAHDSAVRRDEALDRLLRYYAHTAQAASVPIARWPRPAGDEPAGDEPAHDGGPAPAHAPDLTDPEAARTWLRTELPNLDAACAYAQAHHLDHHITALAAGLAEILHSDGPWTRALQIHRAAETAARHNSPAARAAALTDLGRVLLLTGDYPGAADALTQALEIYRRIGNRNGEADSLSALGQVRLLTGDYAGASDAQTQALEIYRRIGNRNGEADTLNLLGQVRHLTGDYPGAADAQTQALEIYRQIGGNRSGEAYTLNNLARVLLLTGDYPGAADVVTRALEIYRQIGYGVGEANALNVLGQLRYLTGDYASAAEALTQGLELHRQLGNLLGEANVLNILGQVRQATGDYQAAVDIQARVLEICRETGDRGSEAYVLNYYAAAIAATGDRPRALKLYQEALAANRELHKPDAEALALEGIADYHRYAADRDAENAADTDTDTAQGIAYLKQALEIYQRLGLRADIARVQTSLADVDES